MYDMHLTLTIIYEYDDNYNSVNSTTPYIGVNIWWSTLSQDIYFSGIVNITPFIK